MHDGACVNFLRASVRRLSNVDPARQQRRLDEIGDLVSSARATLGKAEPPPAHYKPLRALLINWGVYNRYPARQTGILSGEGAIAKSSTLLHLCAAHSLVKLRADWLGAVLDRRPCYLCRLRG
jgi:hypothetical protein